MTRPRITTHDIARKKGGEGIVMVTAYDAWMADIADAVADCILVGDSLGIVVQGKKTTLPVTVDEMVYHTSLVVRGSQHALVIADLPFGSYQVSVTDALRAAGRCLKESGAQAVKLEGGHQVVAQVAALVEAGIPVVGHLGLTPQSIHQIGSLDEEAGQRVGAEILAEDAKTLAEAGVFLLVLEGVPVGLAQQVTSALEIPTIGIGSGPHCDGQVQVFHDLFALGPTLAAEYAKSYCDAGEQMRAAIAAFADEVRMKQFDS